ncbi:DEAD/DEAH box helicase, partial [Leptospira interrogans serovar Bataviae str. HAI135]
MDRLVCGDVGYGKTEVAIRAAFKVAMAGRQIMMLAPTTILALQHYNTFKSRFENYPVRVELVSRFKTTAEIRDILADFSAGKVDMVVGTHAILSSKLKPKNLGLLVIDEEQRFGVNHKETIKKFKNLVDVLTLTATPIPRTLHMALTGIRELSIIATPP